MAIAQVPGYKVRARTQEVVDYHRDDACPGKPLQLLIPGGLVALGSLALIVTLVVKVWWQLAMPPAKGIGLMVLLAPFYIGGVYLFSYGYCLYDVKKALKMTAIIVFVTLAAVVILAVLLMILKDWDGPSGGGSGGGSGSAESSSGSSGSWGSSGSGSGSSGGSGGGGGDWNINLGGGSGSPPPPPGASASHAQTAMAAGAAGVAAVGAAALLLPIRCRHCDRLYVPEQANFVCPGCSGPSDGTEERVRT
jgi:hypothetical protein